MGVTGGVSRYGAGDLIWQGKRISQRTPAYRPVQCSLALGWLAIVINIESETFSDTICIRRITALLALSRPAP
jgi:hypothetical protein